MAPLTGAAKAAVEDFFAGRRGTRSLQPDVRSAMAAYFVGKGLTVPELPTARPSAPELVLEWRAEWRDYAKSAGLSDDADVTPRAASITLRHLPGRVMIADLLTKAPARVVFTELIRLVRTFHEGGIACPSS